MDKKLTREFKQPGREFRGAPFWAWNGRLEPKELRRQVRQMRRMGLGGFFMHSRVGLATAYLAEDWFAGVKACLDEAKKLGMRAWLYDEDRWPSGSAGGLVTKNPRFRRRALILQEFGAARDIKVAAEAMAVFIVAFAGQEMIAYRRVAADRLPDRLAENEKILYCYVEVDQPSSWYNGGTYLDTLNHAAVKEFIRITHEAYRKKIGPAFGRTVPGIFTDEPHYGVIGRANAAGNANGVPWTDKLPAIFKQRYGYDLLDYLPEIVFNPGKRKVSRIRYHYFDCITFLFVDAFSRQIGEWCERNRLQFTGHLHFEDNLRRQARVVGDAMRFYEYMQAPGLDLLTERWRIYDAAKQVSSVARQFGRRWRLSETYGCTGWDFPFAGHKALGDWQAALGINLRCQHLAWYTMLGQAKRDYPAAISYQSPWWKIYAKVEDYFARIFSIMSRGKEVRDVLVIHPMESMWILFDRNRDKDPETARLDMDFARLRDALLTQHLDFDYGDEDIMARHAKIGKKAGKAVLRIGRAEYRAVVVPAMLTIRAATLKVLTEFRKAGGLVVFVGQPADHVDALPSTEVASLANNCVQSALDRFRLSAILSPVARRLSITSGKNGEELGSVLYLLREDRENFYLFICNSGHQDRQLKPEMDADLMVRERTRAFPTVLIRGFEDCAGTPLELDPDDGKIMTTPAERLPNGAWIITTDLPALGSRLFVAPKRRSARPAYPLRVAQQEKQRKALRPSRYNLLLSEDNVLVLDRPRYRIASGEQRTETEILKVDFAVRDHLGIQRRGGQMLQPWAQTPSKKLKRTEVELSYSFTVKNLPNTVSYLALEQPESFTVALNDYDLDSDNECGWWVDRSLRKLAIAPCWFRKGSNQLRLVCDYRENHPGLEIIYLLGKFGVQLNGCQTVITAMPTTLKLGDWVKQGLPFYSGNVSYCCQFRPELGKGEKLFLHCPAYRGTAVSLRVNGREAGIMAWPPDELDLTPCLVPGANELQIEVISHRRNSHGPFHYHEKWPALTGPGEYVSTGDQWTDSYQLVPCGLMRAPELVVKKAECSRLPTVPPQ